MLRIFSDRPAHGPHTLRLAGRITGTWVDELRRVCDELLRQNGHDTAPLALDLAEVSFIDVRGVALLRDLAARHIPLMHCSLFAAELLKEVTDADG